MKKYWKLTALFLTAVMLFASCTSSDDDEEGFTVESNWEYNDFQEDDENPEEEYYFDESEEDDYSGEYEAESEYTSEYADNDSDDVYEDIEDAGYSADAIGMNLSINGVPLMVDWEDNDAVRELNGIVQSETLAIKTNRYGGFEQVGSLGVHLSREDKEMNAQPGDIVLYSGNRIVVFYGENTWSYTPLGHIIGMSENELVQLLGGSSTELVISAG